MQWPMSFTIFSGGDTNDVFIMLVHMPLPFPSPHPCVRQCIILVGRTQCTANTWVQGKTDGFTDDSLTLGRPIIPKSENPKLQHLKVQHSRTFEKSNVFKSCHPQTPNPRGVGGCLECAKRLTPVHRSAFRNSISIRLIGSHPQGRNYIIYYQISYGNIKADCSGLRCITAVTEFLVGIVQAESLIINRRSLKSYECMLLGFTWLAARVKWLAQCHLPYSTTNITSNNQIQIKSNAASH